MSKFKSNKKAGKGKSQNQQNTDLLEKPEALAERLLDTEKIISRNKYLLGGVLGFIVLIVGGYFLYRYMVNSQETEAQENLYPAVYHFQSDSLDLALKGNDNYPGFEEIIEDYGMSPAANLTHFYAGVSYLKKGEFKKAIDHLESFSSSDPLVQARAYCLIGDAQMELKKYKEAADYYKRAANFKPNEFFSPTYLMKLALAQEKQKDFKGALDTYDKVIAQYPKSAELTNAKKFKGQLEAMSQK